MKAWSSMCTSWLVLLLASMTPASAGAESVTTTEIRRSRAPGSPPAPPPIVGQPSSSATPPLGRRIVLIDGRRFEGTLVENIPDVQLTIKKRDGKPLTIPWPIIANIEVFEPEQGQSLPTTKDVPSVSQVPESLRGENSAAPPQSEDSEQMLQVRIDCSEPSLLSHVANRATKRKVTLAKTPSQTLSLQKFATYEIDGDFPSETLPSLQAPVRIKIRPGSYFKKGVGGVSIALGAAGVVGGFIFLVQGGALGFANLIAGSASRSGTETATKGGILIGLGFIGFGVGIPVLVTSGTNVDITPWKF